MSALSTVIARGTIGSRPAAGNPGRVYFSTEPKTYRDNGSSWDDVSDTASGTGGLVFLETHTASASAQLDFTSFISGTYNKYLMVGSELVLATSGADLRVEIGTGGGPTYDTGNNYEWSAFLQSSDGVTTGRGDSGSTGIARIFRAIATTAGYGFGTFSVIATGLQSTALRKTLHGTVEYVNTAPAACYGFWGMQWTTTATAVTAIRFIPSSGNITSGRITIYGMTDS